MSISAILIKKIFQKKEYEGCRPLTPQPRQRRQQRVKQTTTGNHGQPGKEPKERLKRSKGRKLKTSENVLDSLEEETRQACVVIENVEADDIEDFTSAYNPRVTKTDDKKSPRQYSYVCYKCGKNMRNRSRLNLHMKIVHEEDSEERGKICELCGKRVNFDHELELHRKFICREVSRNFPCKVCKISFRSQKEEETHLCTKSAEKPLFCSEPGCQWAGKSFKDLAEHVTRHLGIKPFLCTTCGRSFATKKDMDRHADVHKDMKEFSCSECKLSYKSKRALKHHMIRHKFKDRFKCSHCPFTTALKSSFHEHLLKHKKRSHTCKICNKSLRTAKSLKAHVQNRHICSKIFTCRYCDFTVDNGLQYSSHMRKHRDIKDSGKCEKAFDQSVKLTANISSENIPKVVGGDLRQTTPMATLPDTRSRSAMMTLAATAISDDDTEITAQNSDAMLPQYVATKDTTEMAELAVSDVTNSNLMVYTVEIPQGSTESLPTCSTSILSMTPLMSDSVVSMMDAGNWSSGTEG